MIFNMTGGGAPLNFKVVPNPQPSVATENTIWVDTDRINNYYFSATQPENMVGYDVWFYTSTYSSVEFNVLKKNGIQVYPQFAKQYIGGAWVDKTAKTYQNGQWVDFWKGTLFDNGNQYEAITGGWVNVNGGGLTAAIGTNLAFTVTGSSGRDASVYTSKKINVSGYSTLRCTANITSSSGYLYLGIASNNNTAAPTFIAKVSTAQYSTGSKTLSLSLSGVTNGYIAIWSDQTNATVSKVELVR